MIIRGNTVGTNMSVDRIADKIGCVEPLIVTVDAYTHKASHTSTEMFGHFAKGGSLFYSSAGNLSPPLVVSAEEVVFGVTVDYTLTYLNIDAEGFTSNYQEKFASADDIGNISSALDKLHNYAQGLIEGGGSV